MSIPTMLAGLAGLVVAGMLVGMLISIIVWTDRRPSFKTVFGFKPQNRKRPWSSALRAAEQKKVATVLSRLAQTFATCDKTEREMKIELPADGEFEKWHTEQRKRLADLRRELKTAKEGFWRAYALAEKQEFSVQRKYTDYLP
ncbi:MAG: hypothetical protein HYT49_01865 [Candidatus Wildermuthbacteria bacterium]|nr:hypothetical protein [Candidatus Wildermuthbacteria bacterium]